MDPANPEVLFASSWQRVRGPYFLNSGGPGSALWKTTDGGKTWTEVKGGGLPETTKGRIGIAIAASNPKVVYLMVEADTNKNAQGGAGKAAQTRPSGLYRSQDGGATWEKMNGINVRPFYYSQVRVDPKDPNRVYFSSTPLNYSSDGGKTVGNTTVGIHVDHHAMWIDPTDPNTIYVESQGGNMSRLNFATGDRVVLQKPNWRPRYSIYEDSIVIERPDTAKPETAAQKKRIADLRQRQKSDSNEIDLRWNWNTPFLISAHNPETFYAGANKVMKSTRRGEDLYPISPDLTTKDSMRIRVSTRTTGGVTPDVTGAETFCTIVSLAESPVRPGSLFAGTDDGKVWLTRNDGGTWEDVSGRFPGVPAGTYVSRIEPSHFDTATFYVTFDNHRTNDFAPYVYVTTDFGKTFA